LTFKRRPLLGVPANFLQSSPLKRSKIRHLVPVGLCSHQLCPLKLSVCFLTSYTASKIYGF
jgi:hypothetical protein